MVLVWVQTVKEFVEKIKASGNKDVTLYMYPKEGHGFMNGGKDIHKKMKSEISHQNVQLKQAVLQCCTVLHCKSDVMLQLYNMSVRTDMPTTLAVLLAHGP